MRPSVRDLLLSPLRGRQRQVAGLVVWSVVEAAPAFLSGRLIAWAIDDGFLAHKTGTGFAWLALLGASVLVGAWGTRQVFVRLAALVEPFRDDLMTHAVSGAINRSTAPGVGADTGAVSRLSQQVEIVREGYASVLIVVQGFVVTTVSAIVGLASLDAIVLVFVLPPLVLGLAIFALTLRRMAGLQRRSILADEHIAEGASALAEGLRDVVACGAEQTVAASFGERVDAQAEATVALARLAAVRTFAVSLGGRLPLVLIIAFGPWLMGRGATVGTIVGALTYVLQGVFPALQTLVRGLAGSGLWLWVTLARIAEASAGDAPSELSLAPTRPVGLTGHDLRVEGVTFRYGPHADPVLRGFDLDVPAGEHLAVVGPSGVGKSTLANVVAGMLIPERGRVTIDGTSVRDLDPAALARSRVLIPQEAYVFAGTVWDNLVYLKPSVSTAEVDEAVDGLGARALVDKLGGYPAEVQRASLSAGERQLITLVRAYLAAAPVAILDEATCHLDPGAEAVVEQAFAERGGTLIVIAHRISSAQRAGRILLLDGDGAEVGSHEELVERSALYRDLVGRWASGGRVASRFVLRRWAARQRASVSA